MLSKLLKHEFRATARIMGPLYLVVLITAIGANLSTRVMMDVDNNLVNMMGGLLIAAFVIAIIGVCVMNLVLMIQRFHKNLLGDEGYVMFTLPASVHQQVWSKLIVSSVWFIATGVVVCLAGFIMAYEVGLWRDILRAVRMVLAQITAYYALNGAALAAEFAVVLFVSCVVACLQFYAAMAIGYSFSNHKGLLSVVFFFGSQFVLQMLATVLIYMADVTGLDFWLANLLNFEGMAGVHLSMMILILGEVIYGAIFYIVTTIFLKKHLNLE